MSRIEDVIKGIIIERVELDLSVEEIGDNDYLLTGGLNLESIMILEIIISLEDIYNITFEEEEMTPEQFSSVVCIANSVREKLDSN